MSDATQIIIDRHIAAPQDAERMAADLVDWLASDGIIMRDARDAGGHAPGPSFMLAAGGIKTAASNGNYADFSRLAWNGVRVAAGRECFFNPQGAYGPACCPNCRAEQPLDTLTRAGEAWLQGGAGETACGACGAITPVTAWEHDDIAFALLGIEFRNWPPLSETFLAKVSQRLGHRVTLMLGRH